MARNQDDDRFARESFTFRRMRPWQIWALTLVVVLLAIGLIAYAQ
jgi:hypothetical protein